MTVATAIASTITTAATIAVAVVIIVAAIVVVATVCSSALPRRRIRRSQHLRGHAGDDTPLSRFDAQVAPRAFRIHTPAAGGTVTV